MGIAVFASLTLLQLGANAQEAFIAPSLVDFFIIFDEVELSLDDKYRDLILKHNEVYVYEDSYGVKFYSVICNNDCYGYDEK